MRRRSAAFPSKFKPVTLIGKNNLSIQTPVSTRWDRFTKNQGKILLASVIHPCKEFNVRGKVRKYRNDDSSLVYLSFRSDINIDVVLPTDPKT